jgi:hypothetical protein
MKVAGVRLALVLSLSFFGAASSTSADAAPLKALIVTGQSGHDWRLSTPIIEQILQQTNLFQVDVAISPAEDAEGCTMDYPTALIRAGNSTFVLS